VEIALIRNAVAQARGNVAAAAKKLGISRATVYRKLGRRPPH
jgi:transcriptional regulator of acetoin/glycerol metabolism